MIQTLSNQIENGFYFAAGLIFLFLAKAKHVIHGYATPKPYAISEMNRCIAYDADTVARWLEYARDYLGADFSVKGCKVLELGPGSDLGAGLILLAHGAAKYSAVDAHNLISRVPDAFYEGLLQWLKAHMPGADGGMLRAEWEKQKDGRSDRFDFIPRSDFDVAAAMGTQRADLFLSQAAFEHFENVDKTIAQMTAVAERDAVAILTVDLRTHSRWIRDKDPNNIYRYAPWLYALFHFKGMPNRVRPGEYKAAFERNGWRDIEIKPITRLPATLLERMQAHYYAPYREGKSEMDTLTVLICARRAGRADQ